MLNNALQVSRRLAASMKRDLSRVNTEVAIDATWTNAATYSSIEVRVNEVLYLVLSGSATTVTVGTSPATSILIDVRPVTSVSGVRTACSATAPEGGWSCAEKRRSEGFLTQLKIRLRGMCH